MPPNNSSSSEEEDPSSASFSDDRDDDFQETKSVAPAAKGMKKTSQKEQNGAIEGEPSSPRSAASSRSSAVAETKTKTEAKNPSSKVWVPPALLPIEGVPRLDLPIEAPVRSSEKKKRGETGKDDVFDRLSAGLDALEAAVDAAAAGAAAAGGKKKPPLLLSSRPASAPSSRHLVEALTAAGAIPASAKSKVKVLPSLPGFLEVKRGVGLPATAADFDAWLDDGEEAERKAANLGADDDAAAAASLPRHAAREAARRWLRESHGASLVEAKAEAKAAEAEAAAREEEDGDGERMPFALKKGGFELIPGLGSAKGLLRENGGSGSDGDDGDEGEGFGGGKGRSFNSDNDDEDEDRRSLGRRLAGAAGAVGGAVGGAAALAVSAPLRLVFRRGSKKSKLDAADSEIRYSSPLLGPEMEGEPPLPSSKLSKAQRKAMGPARLAILIAREKARRLAARDAREAAAWRAKQRKLETLRTRSYAQRAADETARLAEASLLGAPPASLSDEEDAAGRAELPQDEVARRPTPSTVVREPAFAAGRKLDRTSRAARPSGVKPAMAPSVLEREFAGRLSLSLFGRGIFGVTEDLEAANGGADFFEGTAEARNPLARFLPPQLRPDPPLVGFGVYARPGSVAKFLGREYVDDEDLLRRSENGDDDSGDEEAMRPTKESRWASMRPLDAVRDPLFFADLMRVAPEVGLTVVAWVPRPLPAAALARALGEAAAANAAAASAAAFRDDLALRRRALAAGALPPLPSPADVVDYAEGVAVADDEEEEEERGRGGSLLGPSWPCLRSGKVAERAARGAAFQLASAAEAAARATAAHEAALEEVAELRRRRAAARTAVDGSPGALFSNRLWRRLGMQLGVRASGRADKIGTSEMGTALPRPALPDSAYVVDRGVFEGSLPEKKQEKGKKKRGEGDSSSSDSDDDDVLGRALAAAAADEDPDLIVIPEGEPWIDAQGNIRPGSKLIFSAAPGGGLVVEALPPSRGFRDDAQAARANGGVPPPRKPKNPLLSPLVDAWKKFGGIPMDPAEDSSMIQPVTDDAKRAKLVACCGPGSAAALLGALLGPKPVDKLARARVGQRAAFELHTPEAEAEAAFFRAAAAASRSSSPSPGPFDASTQNLSMTWLASLDASSMRESMPAMVDSIDAATAPFTLPLLPEVDDGGSKGRGNSSSTSVSLYRRAAPPTLLRGVSAAAAFARRRYFPRREEEEEEEEEDDSDYDYEDEE